MSRFISSPGAGLQKAGLAAGAASNIFSPITRGMSAFKNVSHVIFDMDGLLLGKYYIYIIVCIHIYVYIHIYGSNNYGNWFKYNIET